MSLESIKGARRKTLITLGQRWGSALVKAQANALLGQLQTHQPTLEAHGLLPDDVVELAEWVAQYPEQIEGREVKQLGNTLTTRQLQALMKAAEVARRRGLLRLQETAPRLATAEGQDDAADTTRAALQQVQEVLGKTSRKPQDDPGALAAQLRLIAGALGLAAVMDIARPRGGEAALATLAKAEAALEEAAQEMAQRTSTTTQTEALDLLDGLIVERLREIGRVAKEAAKEEGRPALLEAFRLKLLYG